MLTTLAVVVGMLDLRLPVQVFRLGYLCRKFVSTVCLSIGNVLKGDLCVPSF